MKLSAVALFFALATLSACSETLPQSKKKEDAKPELPSRVKSVQEIYAPFYFWQKSDCNIDQMPIYFIASRNNIIRAETIEEPGLSFDLHILMGPDGAFIYSYTEYGIRMNSQGIEESTEIFNEQNGSQYSISEDGEVRFGKWGRGRVVNYRNDRISFQFDNTERPGIAGIRVALELIRSDEATITPEHKENICSN